MKLTTARLGRPRLSTRDELLLAALPTATVLTVYALVGALSSQRLLFASLAASAFLIYLDPEHAANRVKTLVIAQIVAATVGYGARFAFGPTYLAAASAMITTIGVLVVFDLVHPPAVSTCLAFAFRESRALNVALFVLAVGMVALLVGLERGSLWLVHRARARADAKPNAAADPCPKAP